MKKNKGRVFKFNYGDAIENLPITIRARVMDDLLVYGNAYVEFSIKRLDPMKQVVSKANKK